MVPILGMQFKDHEEMKIMLANYGVANDYQLWYKMNDYKSLLVLCGRNVKEGRCASKVGKEKVAESKGKEKVAEGKGKEKVVEGKCKEKAAEGSKAAEALKDGWNEGCKKVIGLDGCFLKGTIKGELLIAMVRDANNQMFLIAWDVVTMENKDNQLWFHVSLGDDLNLNRGATVTIISDVHKMDRSCEAFKNGICESYHAAIVNQRGKPIITMLEDIKIYLIQSLVIMSDKARGLTDIITPYVRKELENLKGYLRRWDLTRIPCIHGVAAYAFLIKDPADGVSECYSKRAGQNSYSCFIKPVDGQSMWVKSGLPPLMPPKKRTMPGRPKGKKQLHPSESGFESATSALKRMRMDATASGGRQNEIEQPMHMEEPVQEANVQEHVNKDKDHRQNVQEEELVQEPVNANEEPAQMKDNVQEPSQMEDNVQAPVLRSGLRLRRPSQRIILNKWKNHFSLMNMEQVQQQRMHLTLVMNENIMY
ncbi:zinc finger, PMZ-type containing protein [Tanacetum coccineum]